MADRNRPRLNITMEAEIKEKLKETAERLNVTVSRLLEEIAREFLSLYEDDPLVGQKVKKEIDQRKHRTPSGSKDQETRQQIEKILEELEKI